MGNLKDYGTSTVLTAPSPADSGTSLVVQSGHGARFPAAPFYATVHPSSEFPTLDNAEKVLVTNKSTDTFTIDRGEGDTTPLEIEAGWRISNSLFLADIPDTFDDLTDGSTNVAFTTTLKSKLDAIEASADVTDATNVAAAGAVMESDTSTASMSFVVDEDDMSSNSATKLSTQQSIKAYVDAAVTAAKTALMPIGTVVVLGVSTDPATLYGFGTWTRIQGRFIVASSASDGDFDLNDTGGAKTHTHTLNGTGYANVVGEGTNLRIERVDDSVTRNINHRQWAFGAAAFETYNTTMRAALSGSTQTVSNLPPFIAKFVWERTA